MMDQSLRMLSANSPELHTPEILRGYSFNKDNSCYSYPKDHSMSVETIMLIPLPNHIAHAEQIHHKIIRLSRMINTRCPIHAYIHT